MTYNEYKLATPIKQAFYREYEFAADHKDGFFNGQSDKEANTPKTANKANQSFGYVTGYNAGYYLA